MTSLAESRELILIVDDEPHICQSLSFALKNFGFQTMIASSVREAQAILQKNNVDIILSDLRMGDGTGLDLLDFVKHVDPTVSFVMMTAHGTIETAIDAMKMGAEDYLQKPVDILALELLTRRIVQRRYLRKENHRLQAENRSLKENLDVRFHLSSMLGASPAVKDLMDKIKKFASLRDKPVMLLGEPGTHLTEISQMLHYNSPWSSNTLIQFDCSMVPSELHEAQLFGYEEARDDSDVQVRGHDGLVEKAHFGSIVISNLDHLEPACQAMLSRVFYQKKSQRAGGTHFYGTDVRVIGTALQSEIESQVRDREFRWDLWDQMAENKIVVPPLRSRKEDLPIIILAEAKRWAGFYNKDVQKIEAEVIDRLSKHNFPGNYRELESMVESAVIRTQTKTLLWSDFKLTL